MDKSSCRSTATSETQNPTGADAPVGLLSCDEQPIFLVGMMGAGKTTIGRSLARLLDRKFLDLDHELEARCGVRVSLIFDIEGEEGFRRRETALLDECSRRPGIILATGGGAVLNAENRRYLRERGVVVYLHATADELYRRVARDRTRPLLQTPDPRARLQSLLVQREPLYQEVAAITVETGIMPISQVAHSLISLLKEHQSHP
ncbi:MAG: shikimate kinase [Paralcaligenes sp.]